MKTLVTGAAGFVGKHLLEHLRSESQEVYGTTKSSRETEGFVTVDLMNFERLRSVLDQVRPGVIYHLAAFSSPALSFKQPVAAINETLAMEINLYEACLQLNIPPKFIIISSGQIYGKAGPKELPLSETSSLDFNSPYTVAKVGQENLAKMYAKRGFNSIIARPFNHIGPGQQPGFLVSDLAKQIAELEKHDAPTPLKVGNLSSKRDFTDVRDIVRAYSLLAEKGVPGEVYNVCSGRSVPGQQILNQLLSLSSKPIKAEPDPAKMRPSDIPDLYGDATKIHQATGWQPVIPLEQTLRDVLDDWRLRA
ncbi:GDP-mannose 4,6-dehydratase [Candidatus Parcubacteria bacterium]|nr:GDP-mannose 4,6-dehydratase [Candidatus Parcubacteria bacterium]